MTAPVQEEPHTPMPHPTTTPTPRSRQAILWSYAQPHWKTLLFALTLGLGVSAANLANPMVTRWVLDSLNAPQLNLLPPLAALGGLMIISAILRWWQTIALGSLAETIVYDARESMIRRYLRSKILPLSKKPTGELVTRVTSDSVLLREAASTSLVGLVNGIVMLVGTLVLMAILDTTLVLATVIAVSLVVLIFVKMTPAIGKAEQQSQRALGSLGGKLEAMLRAMKTVKAAGAQNRQEHALLTQAAEAQKQGIIAVRRRALAGTAAMTGVQIAIMIILSLGAWRVALGEMTVSTLVAFLLYAFGTIAPIGTISESIMKLQSGLAAAGRIQEIESIELERTHAIPTPTNTTDTSIITFDNVVARYLPTGAPIINGVNLNIPHTGHTAIVGPSGAGKTSLLSLMLDFMQPETGEIRLNGTPYQALTPTEIRTHFAYVEQETPTLPGTLRDNLTFANPEATTQQIQDVLRTVRLDEYVTNLPDGLDTELTDTNVSGGQRQRIALARAILSQPQILLLDEATAQLDGLSEAAIHDAITHYAQEHAVITVAHRLSTVIDADTIAVMQAGSIIAHGTHHQLLEESPLYHQLVAALSLDK